MKRWCTLLAFCAGCSALGWDEVGHACTPGEPCKTLNESRIPGDDVCARDYVCRPEGVGCMLADNDVPCDGRDNECNGHVDDGVMFVAGDRGKSLGKGEVRVGWTGEAGARALVFDGKADVNLWKVGEDGEPVFSPLIDESTRFQGAEGFPVHLSAPAAASGRGTELIVAGLTPEGARAEPAYRVFSVDETKGPLPTVARSVKVEQPRPDADARPALSFQSERGLGVIAWLARDNRIETLAFRSTIDNPNIQLGSRLELPDEFDSKISEAPVLFSTASTTWLAVASGRCQGIALAQILDGKKPIAARCIAAPGASQVRLARGVETDTSPLVAWTSSSESDALWLLLPGADEIPLRIDARAKSAPSITALPSSDSSRTSRWLATWWAENGCLQGAVVARRQAADELFLLTAPYETGLCEDGDIPWTAAASSPAWDIAQVVFQSSNAAKAVTMKCAGPRPRAFRTLERGR
jgi:hypothetical protein